MVDSLVYDYIPHKEVVYNIIISLIDGVELLRNTYVKIHVKISQHKLKPFFWVLPANQKSGWKIPINQHGFYLIILYVFSWSGIEVLLAFPCASIQ